MVDEVECFGVAGFGGIIDGFAGLVGEFFEGYAGGVGFETAELAAGAGVAVCMGDDMPDFEI